MPRGGHARSGPQKDPNSIKSTQLGYALTALPAAGHAGEAPALDDFLLGVTDRHQKIWLELWTTPQASAWAVERWRWPIVADLVMLRVRADDPESPAGLATSIRQLRDDLGLSKAGLAANGWTIAQDQLAAKRDEKASEPPKPSARDRMKVVRNGDGA